MAAHVFVYVGTYTRLGRAEGIYVYRLELSTGELVHVQTRADVADPSYLTLSSDGRVLYAVNELSPDGAVSAFAVDPATHTLALINTVASHGATPAHLSVDPSGRWVLVANYSGGTVATFPIEGDGSLGEAASVIHHEGSGPNPARQEGPHPHMIVTDPDGHFVLVPDLGADRVVAYTLDTSTGQLTEQPGAGGYVEPGAGPRHMTFSADGRHAYVLNEIASTVSMFDYEAPTGHMDHVETLSTLPEDFVGKSTTAAIVMHPSGRFVYASNRGHDSIAVFSVDQSSGKLTARGQTPAGGRNPRDFNVDPSGTYLLAAHSESDTITTFHINPDSGALEPTGHVREVPSPVRVLFAS
jgi:6-phosphogluconolactonase